MDSHSLIYPNSFDNLPTEAIVSLFLCIPPKVKLLYVLIVNICCLSSVCKEWYRLAHDTFLWKQICLDRWGQNLYYQKFEIDINQIETKTTRTFIKMINKIDWEADDNKDVPFVNKSGGNQEFSHSVI